MISLLMRHQRACSLSVLGKNTGSHVHPKKKPSPDPTSVISEWKKKKKRKKEEV